MKAARVPEKGQASASLLANENLSNEASGVQPESEESQPGSQRTVANLGEDDNENDYEEPDFTEDATLQWYVDAAGRGDSGAAFALGCMHDDGARGCPQNYALAAKW
jgi:TPR repeat protein